jgi:competence protein ComEC
MPKIIFQAPFLRLTLFLAAGILLQMQFNLNQHWYITAIISLPLIFLSFTPYIIKCCRLQWLFGVGIFLLCSSTGGLLTRQYRQKSIWQDVNEKRTYRVQVLDEAVTKPKTLMFRVKTGSQQALVYLPKDSAAYALRPADSLIIHAHFHQTDFPYHRNHLIAATVFVNDWKKIEPAGKQPFNIRFTALKCRRYLFEHLHRLIPEDKEFSLAAALMFGYTENMDKELRQTFAATGSAHILSVSGLHFSIIYGILYFLFSFFGNSKYVNIIRQAIILPILWGFAFLTGMQPCVIRAALMLTLWGIGDAFQVRSFTFNTLSVAAFVLLLYNPLNLFDAGFQLSFAAVTAILVIYPHISELLEPQNPILSYAWRLSCISVAAQVGVAPLSIYYFHQFPVLFLVANLFAIPLTAILLGLIPVSLALGFTFGNAVWPAVPLNKILSIFISVLEWIESIPNALFHTGTISVMDTVCMFLALIFTILTFTRKRIFYLILLITVLIFVIIYNL